MAFHPQTLFGRRLRCARKKIGLAQDRLGVLIGLDEGCSSARISRYESGLHEPPFAIAEKLATALGIPVAYLYCPDEEIAELLLKINCLSQENLSALKAIITELATTNPEVENWVAVS